MLTPEPSLQPLDLLVPEAVLAFFLLLLLVWFLNREFEVSYHLHYHGNVEADKHRFKIQTMRDQAEWLLGNIIPIHVADQLKVSEDFKNISEFIRTVPDTSISSVMHSTPVSNDTFFLNEKDGYK